MDRPAWLLSLMHQGSQWTQNVVVDVQVQAGMQLLSNSPCLFSTNLGAIEASATGVSVAPSVVNVGSTAINVAPQAMSISPVSPRPFLLSHFSAKFDNVTWLGLVA